MLITQLQQQFYTDGYTFYRKWVRKPHGVTEQWEKVSLRKIRNALLDFYKTEHNKEEVVTSALERITYGNEQLETSYILIKAVQDK
jgi:hypothetical protein